MRNLVLLFLLMAQFSIAQEKSYSDTETSITRWIDGSLMVPEGGSDVVAIIIAGSGPTDRDGNQNFLKSNNLKKLAIALAAQGIASFRYDKRSVKQIKTRNLDLKIMFDDFVNDAIDVVEYFHKDPQFKKIYVIGHSQGSLIGMLASKQYVDGFISISGAGQSIDQIVIEQVQKTAPLFTDETKRVFNILREGDTTTDYPPALASIFDSSIQKFMMNWMKYDPATIIKTLEIPVLIINGNKDLQVEVAEAERLHKANGQSQLKIIDDMNHVLFIIHGDNLENSKSYNEQHRTISEELVKSIVDFIKEN